MTDNVINLSDHRKKKPPPSPQEVASFSVTSIMEEWERFAKANKLNDFVTAGLGAHAKPFTSYLNNLTEIAVIEQKLDLLPGIWAPGVNGPSQLGWRACFRFGDILIETPDMAFEAHARCCNILIFQKVKREMVALSRP